MANTSDLRLSSVNWTLVSTDPAAITIKSNGINNWHVSIKDTAGAPDISLVGEVHLGGSDWESGSIIGGVYIRGTVDDLFSISVQAGV